MDAEMQQRIEETVLEILKGSEMTEMTEFKIRSIASEKLGLDLSIPERKRFVRQVVESFLVSKKIGDSTALDDAKLSEKSGQEEDEEAEEEKDEEDNVKAKEYDDEGNLVICRLSSKRKVTIQDFKGRMLISIREYYDKGGKELPSNKGISLTADQWFALRDAVSSIETAIGKLHSRKR